jgi:hypothetical protein
MEAEAADCLDVAFWAQKHRFKLQKQQILPVVLSSFM